MKLRTVHETGSAPAGVEEAIGLLAQSIVDTRTLIFDLSPPILYELGLRDALSWLAEDLGKRWGMNIDVNDDDFAKPLSDGTAGLVFRAVRELLGNVLEHAQIPSAKLMLRRTGDHVEITVEDHGVSFEPQAAVPSAAGFGLFSVREQIHRLGGTMELASDPGKGTRVTLRLPWTSSTTGRSGPVTVWRSATRSVPSEVHDMKILLCDDHRMRDGLRVILEKEGFEVMGEAANGREPMASARSAPLSSSRRFLRWPASREPG
jgi:signal transduction histidine kinase